MSNNVSGVVSAHKAKDAKHKQQFISKSQTFINGDDDVATEHNKYILRYYYY